MKLFLTAFIIFFLCVPIQALACDCVRPNDADSQSIIEQAYIIVHGTVKGVTPIAQHYGVVDEYGPSRAHIDVVHAYDQPFEGALHVDFNRSYSNCEIGMLEIGTTRDFIIYKDEQNVLYIPNRCVDLTQQAWDKLQQKAKKD